MFCGVDETENFMLRERMDKSLQRECIFVCASSQAKRIEKRLDDIWFYFGVPEMPVLDGTRWGFTGYLVNIQSITELVHLKMNSSL